MQRNRRRKIRALKTTPRKARQKAKSLTLERALNVIGDYLHSLEDANQRAAIVQLLLTLARRFDAKPSPAAKRNPEAQPDALAWKDCEPNDRGPHAFEATTAKGIYRLVPGFEYDSPGMGEGVFCGYFVEYLPPDYPKTDHRIISIGIKDLEQAKVIAQADHDAGHDR